MITLAYLGRCCLPSPLASTMHSVLVEEMVRREHRLHRTGDEVRQYSRRSRSEALLATIDRLTNHLRCTLEFFVNGVSRWRYLVVTDKVGRYNSVDRFGI